MFPALTGDIPLHRWTASHQGTVLILEGAREGDHQTQDSGLGVTKRGALEWEKGLDEELCGEELFDTVSGPRSGQRVRGDWGLEDSPLVLLNQLFSFLAESLHSYTTCYRVSLLVPEVLFTQL